MKSKKPKLPKAVAKFYESNPEAAFWPDGGLGHGGLPARREMLMCRVTMYEKNELHLLARSVGMSSSYMVRKALEKMFPKIFIRTNHNIKKPRAPKPIQPRTKVMVSLVDGTKTLSEDLPNSAAIAQQAELDLSTK